MAEDKPTNDSPLVQQTRVDPTFFMDEAREENKLGDAEQPDPVVIELNLQHPRGLKGARERFQRLYEELGVAPWGQPRGRFPAPLYVGESYCRCHLTIEEINRLVQSDFAEPDPRRRAIHFVWADYLVKPLIDRSTPTVKADAARRSYAATGQGITWAVIDSGIDAGHPHFRHYDTLDLGGNGGLGTDAGAAEDDEARVVDQAGEDVGQLHRDFTVQDQPDDVSVKSALTDAFGHGTHVAGIIAGGLVTGEDSAVVGEHQSMTDPAYSDQIRELEPVQRRPVDDVGRLSGVAPQCKLVSLKVLDENGEGRTSDVMRALQYVRRGVNGEGKLLRIHGVNLSVGYEFNAKAYACGQSPLCVEVDKLVRSGVVVVAAAGNTGFGKLGARERATNTGLALTINDPGNAALAITVGSTHRDMPHTYGVSYFSSKGPTGDGRLKPDLVAPGERITSCAAGKKLEHLKSALKLETETANGTAFYVDDSGTSMAAPHVSGAVAAFLSIRREFIGRSDEVKRLFLETATSLGRERYFQGHGLVDLMRAIQAV